MRRLARTEMRDVERAPGLLPDSKEDTVFAGYRAVVVKPWVMYVDEASATCLQAARQRNKEQSFKGNYVQPPHLSKVLVTVGLK